MNRNRIQNARQRRNKFRTWGNQGFSVESLEQRALLTSNLYIDFGDHFPTGGLDLKALQIQDTFINGGIQGPPVLLSGALEVGDILNLDPLTSVLNFDYDQDGSEGTANDYSLLRANVLAIVQRIYMPFDVDVQIAPALDSSNTTSSKTASDL